MEGGAAEPLSPPAEASGCAHPAGSSLQLPRQLPVALPLHFLLPGILAGRDTPGFSSICRVIHAFPPPFPNLCQSLAEPVRRPTPQAPPPPQGPSSPVLPRAQVHIPHAWTPMPSKPLKLVSPLKKYPQTTTLLPPLQVGKHSLQSGLNYY